MTKKLFIVSVLTALVLSVVVSATGQVAFADGPPKIGQACKMCHQPNDAVVRGNLSSVSEGFKTVSVAVGSFVWVFRYDDSTKLVGADSVKSIPKEKEVAVTFKKEGERKYYAESVSVKPPAKVSAEKLLTVAELQKLVQIGTDKGNYVLVDSRPAQKFNEGHIPGAVSLPFANFDKLKDSVLPTDKTKLVIFYCAGITCRLSPSSATAAEKLGYTNVKIFLGGMPDWKKAGGLVVSEPKHLKDVIAKNLSFVLVDLRPSAIAEKGFIKGAVGVPKNELEGKKQEFPKDLSSPIILYSNDNAEDAFKTVRGWGYKDATVLSGGIDGWTKFGGATETGKLEKNIVYEYRPGPGEVSIDEFKAIAKGGTNTIILDVRDADEAAGGVIQGSINIPSAQIKDRMKELPKDKDIVVHCLTGTRAQGAYEELKEAGYKVRYLNAVIQIGKDGKFEISGK